MTATVKVACVALLLCLVLVSHDKAMADEVISLDGDWSCAVHEVNFGTRTVDCIKGPQMQSRWICEVEGEVVCRLEGNESVTHSFFNPFNGHLCKKLCTPR